MRRHAGGTSCRHVSSCPAQSVRVCRHPLLNLTPRDSHPHPHRYAATPFTLLIGAVSAGAGVAHQGSIPPLPSSPPCSFLPPARGACSFAAGRRGKLFSGVVALPAAGQGGGCVFARTGRHNRRRRRRRYTTSTPLRLSLPPHTSHELQLFLFLRAMTKGNHYQPPRGSAPARVATPLSPGQLLVLTSVGGGRGGGGAGLFPLVAVLFSLPPLLCLLCVPRIDGCVSGLLAGPRTW